VWLAWGTADALQAERLQLEGDRSAVRRQTVEQAFHRLAALLGVAA
jgi:nicotinamide mononucleotide (NMN) deamidase PncC